MNTLYTCENTENYRCSLKLGTKNPAISIFEHSLIFSSECLNTHAMHLHVRVAKGQSQGMH